VIAAARQSGLARRVTPHMLRHTAATLLMERGVDIRVVQRLLGHQSILTTQAHVNVRDGVLRDAVARAGVLSFVTENRALKLSESPLPSIL